MRVDDVAAMGALVAVVGIVIGVSLLNRRNTRAKQRLDLLQESLQHPQLDPQTRNQILSVLAKEHGSSLFAKLMSGAFWQRIFFGCGWLMFVFCGGMAFLSWSGIVSRNIVEYALIWALIGLAVASLPFALSELSSRQRRVAE